MSRRGHKTGIISNYDNTWLLKTNGEGCVWISDPISYDTEGTDIRASVTEVRQCKARYLRLREGCHHFDNIPVVHRPASRGSSTLSRPDFGLPAGVCLSCFCLMANCTCL